MSEQSSPNSEHGAESANAVSQLGDLEIVRRSELQHTANTEHGPTYRCPRCGYEYVHEYCDCPECLWKGMCVEGFE